MSKWSHEMALKTYSDLQKRKNRREEGVRQANNYMFENRSRCIGLRTRKKNGKVVVSQV